MEKSIIAGDIEFVKGFSKIFGWKLHYIFSFAVNPISHGLFQVGSIRRGEGGGAQSARGLFSETVKLLQSNLVH